MQAVTFFIAFVVVLALIGVAAWLVRRFASSRLGTHTNRGRMPRLAVIDAAAVDGRRRLVLVRRDNIEHLLMIGGPTDIVVESNIVRATASRDQTPQRAAANEPPPRIAPLPEPSWADAEARAEAFDPGEPQMPEQPPRPVRPSFAEEMRRPASAHAERRAEPLAGLTPEPIGGRQDRPELRPEPRLEPRPEPMHGRTPPRGEPIMPRPSRQSEAPKAPAVRAAAPPPPPDADQNLAEMAQR
ncbi:MAG: flagellar biosynthetic protein FliO, partial [Bradyrhizobium sp.]